MRSVGTLVLSFGIVAGMACGESAARNVRFNGRQLSPDQIARLEQVERYYGVRLPDNEYWYDNRSGAAGLWHGPALAALPAGLNLGGPMPADCSGGGTGVFINGRELHPIDVAVLQQLGPVYRGRYWVDANGFFGLEGGPAVGNLFLLARSSGQRGPHRVYEPGELSGLTVNSAGACTSAGNCAYPGR